MRTGATFRLFGDGDALTAAEVSSLLGLEPTKACEAGDPRSRRTLSAHSSSSWQLSTEVEDDMELDAQLRQLLTILEPRAAELWHVVERGYTANWFCYVGSQAAEHAVVLDRELMTRLLALPGDLWLDVYEDGPAT
jgi:hypothetical protein